MPVTHYTSYRRRRKRRNFYAVLLIILFVLLIAGGCFWYLWQKKDHDAKSSSVSSGIVSEETENSAAAENSLPPPEPEESVPAAVTDSAVSSEETVQSELASSEAVSPESSAEEPELPEESEPEAVTYDFTLPVPEADPVDKQYFDDALFIGDSRTQGLVFYTGLSNTTSYADKGLSVDKVFSKETVHEGETSLTVAAALENHPNTYKKVYLMFGINEIGWQYLDIFQSKYQEVVQKVRETQPEALIYVQSILPVSHEKSDSSDIYNIQRIAGCNKLIAEMAAEEQVFYLDPASALSDENGYLPDEASTDGIHLNKSYCQVWLDYLLKHTVNMPPAVTVS